VQAVNDVRETLRQTAPREHKPLVSVGISLDQDPLIGIDFLKRFGPFDEVLSGGGWLNTGSIAFVVRHFPARRAIPQLIIVERDVVLESNSASILNERLISRKIGADAIVRFAADIALRDTPTPIAEPLPRTPAL
jgi:hypothetical protein